MLSLIKRFWAWIKSWVTEESIQDDPKEVPLYLACNGMYIAIIESIERQIEQTEIDYAIGTIDSDTYNRHYQEFQQKVKELSANYARELLLYSA